MGAQPRRGRVFATLVAAGALTGTAVLAVPQAAAASGGQRALYIVQLAQLPAGAYTGTLPGYPATRPGRGRHFDPTDRAVVGYRGYLRSTHRQVAARVPDAQQVYDYTTAFNGFAARMTATDAAALAQTAGVVSVTKNEIRHAETISTPDFLGLTQAGGLWEQLGGPDSEGAGRNIVIGVIDSGISPDNPSFAPLASAGRLKSFHGVCQAAHDGSWTASDCTNKIVGARWYDAGRGGDNAVLAAHAEYLSARDHVGHGSHTAGTAAGDYNTPVVVNGDLLGNASGMAPNARIAVYKALWDTGVQATGNTADLVAAINDAVADGVDVINYSVAGSATSSVDPVESAFLNAADAGVFVAASAGNNGPTASAVAHNSPWLTTVAAGTHDRAFRATVTLGNGASYTGTGIGAAVPSAPIALSSATGLAGAGATGVQQCFSTQWDPAHPEGFLDPAKVAGKIVVCDRGGNQPLDKSRAVQEAGGVGMVLANVSPAALNTDFHFVPTVNVSDTDAAAIKAYVGANPDATASLSAGQQVLGVRAPQVASFSARGPALAAGGDLLKPDVMAPGLDVLAASAPVSHSGRSFDFDSGTSVAAPHIAGIAALIKQAHKTWTPMEIKSALMTSASTTDNTGAPITTDTGGPAGAFDYGSGEVTPNSAVDPGLLYNSSRADWTRFLCGSGQISAASSTCAQFGAIDPSDLNTPNIAIGALVGTQTVTRTVTNAQGNTATYSVQVQAPAGFAVSVQPTVLKFSPKVQSRQYSVTLTRISAPFRAYQFGSLTWGDGKHRVRSQLAVRPVGAAAPTELAGADVAGSTEFSVTSGFAGTMSSSVAGLVAATDNSAELSAPSGSSFNTASPAISSHTARFTISVPAGTNLARFRTFDSDVPAGTDLDLFVYRGTTLVGSSLGPTAAERVDLANPTAANYDVYVNLFALAPGVTSQAVHQFTWALGTADAGNLTVTPASAAASPGEPVTFTASWAGLTAGVRYLGAISLSDGTTTVAKTLLTVTA